MDKEVSVNAQASHAKAGSRSKTSQGKGWNSVLNAAKRVIKERPNDHLCSILAELREVNISRKDPGRYYRTKEIASPIGDSIFAKEAISDNNRGFFYPDVANGTYRVSTISPIRYLSSLIRPDTTAVMELGSGWSSNLFQVYLAYGQTRSKKIIYYGGEYTKEGQICAKFLANHDKNINYRSFQFDYRDPNVTFLKRQRGHILLFTTHSIEQVDTINPVLFQQLQEISNPVTVVHFEPVGWQRLEHLLKMRNENDTAAFETLGKRAVTGMNDDVAENAAWWSWRLDYNKNLLPIVRDLEDQKAIRMIRTAFDYSGTANVLNPMSLLHFEFIRPDRTVAAVEA